MNSEPTTCPSQLPKMISNSVRLDETWKRYHQSAVELCHGFLPSLLLFVFPAIGGTILSAIFLPRYISVGASGGIFGLIGACLADIFMNWGLLFNDFVTGDRVHHHTIILIVLLLDIFINSLVGLTPFVDNFTREYYAFFFRLFVFLLIDDYSFG